MLPLAAARLTTLQGTVQLLACVAPEFFVVALTLLLLEARHELLVDVRVAVALVITHFDVVPLGVLEVIWQVASVRWPQPRHLHGQHQAHARNCQPTRSRPAT